jgi:hypothetical protein
VTSPSKGHSQPTTEAHACQAGARRSPSARVTLALYYLYRHHLTNDGMGPQGRYYLSKDGRVFYKDGQDREHTVNAPSEGLRVPRAAADPDREIRGYAGRQDGRDLRGLAADDEKK